MKEKAANRRGFLRQTGQFVLAAAIAASGVSRAVVQIPSSELDVVTPGDIAILQFLAAAEALENDLWQQYTELSQGNFAYQTALQRIDPSLITYINDDRRDELSHFQVINGVLGQISPSLPIDGGQIGDCGGERHRLADRATSCFRQNLGLTVCLSAARRGINQKPGRTQH